MRIALIPSAYAPAVGGVELLSADLARHVLDAGDAVEIWTIRHPSNLPEDETLDGVRVRRFSFPMPRAHAGVLMRLPYSASVSWARLRRAEREFAPDVLHVQCFSANGTYAHALASRAGLPLIITLQGETMMDDFDLYQRSASQRLSLRRALGGAAAVTACSAFVLDDARRHFNLKLSVGSVIPNGVDRSPRLAPDPIALPFTHFILGLGRLVAKKGFDLLIDAFARVAEHQPNVGLVIAGDGPEGEPLRRKVSQSSIATRVTFTGRVTRAQGHWLMSRAAMFVLPSRIEPFGIVVLEALRSGCPAIVSSCGGAPEIVRDGVEGLVADPTDTVALATKIATLLDDATLAARLAAAGRARVEKYYWPRITSCYRELYGAVGGV